MRIAAAVPLAAAAAAAAPAGWHGSLADGLVAAKRSGKPLLVVTAWSDRQ
jgi:hypothetical protein